MDITKRNYDGVPLARFREKIDPPFIEAMAALDAAFYGPLDEDGRRVPNTGWQNNKSSPWNGYDKQATIPESQALFQQLQATLHCQYEIALWEAMNKPQAKLTDVERALRNTDVDPNTELPVTVRQAQEFLAKVPAEKQAVVAVALQAGAEKAVQKEALRAQGRPL